MENFVSIVGWIIVAAAVAAYGWVLYRVLLFPNVPRKSEDHEEHPRWTAKSA
jgi:hypothetical protein